jgi:peptidyl-tRNA hydrolase
VTGLGNSPNELTFRTSPKTVHHNKGKSTVFVKVLSTMSENEQPSVEKIIEYFNSALEDLRVSLVAIRTVNKSLTVAPIGN